MTRFIILGFIMLFSVQVWANCDCTAILKNVILQVETNAASYQDQVILQQRQIPYFEFKTDLLAIASKTSDLYGCTKWVSRYLYFFKDQNLQLTVDNRQLNRFYLPSTSVVDAPTTKVDAVEGLWFLNGGPAQFKIVPDTSNYRHFVAIEWPIVGNQASVILEIAKNAEGHYEAFFPYDDLGPRWISMKMKEGKIYLGSKYRLSREGNPFQVIEEEMPVMESDYENQAVVKIKPLNAQTMYLELPFFEDEMAEYLASNEAYITTLPNLIVDLRGNSTEGPMYPYFMVPWFADKLNVEEPMVSSTWLSKDNFEWYKSTVFDYAFTKNDSLEAAEYLTLLSEYKGNFSPSSKETYELDRMFPNLKNVGLIIDQHTSNAAEAWALWCKNSPKCKVFGVPSQGNLSYGETRWVAIPDFPGKLSIPSQKHSFTNEGYQEGEGIQPDYPLPFDRREDWLIMVTKRMR